MMIHLLLQQCLCVIVPDATMRLWLNFSKPDLKVIQMFDRFPKNISTEAPSLSEKGQPVIPCQRSESVGHTKA